jgi:hypothetical protein
MDYKQLLKKYIRHVEDMEGVNFVEGADESGSREGLFNSEEWAELTRLCEESEDPEITSIT